MSYLIIVGAFGCIAVFFLWFRDLRIAMRTGDPAYRISSKKGLYFGVLALIGFFITANGVLEILGLGIILLALYLQGRDKRSVRWGNAGVIDRALGKAPLQKKP